MHRVDNHIPSLPDYLQDFIVESPSTIYSVESAWSNLSFESKISLIQYYSKNKFFTNYLFSSRLKKVLLNDGNVYLIIKSAECNLLGIYATLSLDHGFIRGGSCESVVDFLSKNPIAELYFKEQTSSKVEGIDNVLNSNRIDRLAFVRAFQINNIKVNVFESLLIQYYQNRQMFSKINDSDVLEMLQEYDAKPVFYNFQKGRLFNNISNLYVLDGSLPQIIPSSHKNIISKYITVEKWKELFFTLNIDVESEKSLIICSNGIFDSFNRDDSLNRDNFEINDIEKILNMPISKREIFYGRLAKCESFNSTYLISMIIFDIEHNRQDANQSLKDIQFQFNLRIENVLSSMKNKIDLLFMNLNRIQIVRVSFYMYYNKNANKIISDRNLLEKLNLIVGDSPINIISKVWDVFDCRGGASEANYWRLRKFIGIDGDYLVDNLKSNGLKHRFILDIEHLLINLNSLLNAIEDKNKNNSFVFSKLFKITFLIMFTMMFYEMFFK